MSRIVTAHSFFGPDQTGETSLTEARTWRRKYGSSWRSDKSDASAETRLPPSQYAFVRRLSLIPESIPYLRVHIVQTIWLQETLHQGCVGILGSVLRRLLYCQPPKRSTNDQTVRPCVGWVIFVFGKTLSTQLRAHRKRYSERSVSDMRESSADGRSQPWDQLEDAKLVHLVVLCGQKKWPQVAAHFAMRSSSQCRSRWYTLMASAVSCSPWSLEEDTLLVQLQSRVGNQWWKIAQRLLGRTWSDVRKRWYAVLRPMLKSRSLRTIVVEARRPEKNPLIISAGMVSLSPEDEVSQQILGDAAFIDGIVRSLTSSP